jgi:hypothetical protein
VGCVWIDWNNGYIEYRSCILEYHKAMRKAQYTDVLMSDKIPNANEWLKSTEHKISIRNM